MQNVFNSIKIFAILTKNFHVYTYAEQSNLITRCYTRRFKVLCTCVLNKHHCRFTLWNIYLLFIPFRFPPFLQVTFVRFSSSLFKTNVPPVFFMYLSILAITKAEIRQIGVGQTYTVRIYSNQEVTIEQVRHQSE